MAPVMVMGELSSVAWSSSPALAIISTVVFLTLSITLLTLCMRCRRNPDNAYEVNTASAGQQDANGGTKSGDVAYTTWRNHDSMPTNSLERAAAIN